MSSFDLFDIDKQIKHWEERVSGLEKWLYDHSTDHTDWDQNRRDYNNAKIKLQQLHDRNNKPGYMPTIYSLPNFKH